MARKLKNYYDVVYLKDLAEKLNLETDEFNYKGFLKDVMVDLENLEFNNRQILISENLKKHINLNYEDTINVFTKILGPEMKRWVCLYVH